MLTRKRMACPGARPTSSSRKNGDNIDNIVPTRGFGTLPVVGLGGSAGGLAALQIVLRRHAAGQRAWPSWSSCTSRPSTRASWPNCSSAPPPCPCCRCTGGSRWRPNHVYVIPPAKHLSMDDGHLSLSQIRPPHGQARRRGPVLPHAGGYPRPARGGHRPLGRGRRRGHRHQAHQGTRRPDGRAGPGRSRARLHAPRRPSPRAWWTGCCPWRTCPRGSCEYWRAEGRLQLPPEEGPPARARRPRAGSAKAGRCPGVEAALRDILSLLRVRTGHDFTYYKRATILRRIARRMQVNGIEEVRGLPRFHPHASRRTRRAAAGPAHQRDEFFPRPRGVRGAGGPHPLAVPGQGTRRLRARLGGGLRHGRGSLFRGHAAASSTRGRSTARPSSRSSPPTSTRTPSRAPATAMYPETISADVSPDRLRRFFARGHAGYRVKRELRETVLFALHDLFKDSPFSRLDLITCRNLFIYLNRDAQTRALEIFHFALRVEGTLFLGTSESVDDDSPLFSVVDKKRRLYARRGAVRAPVPVFLGSVTLPRAMLERPPEGEKPYHPTAFPAARTPPPPAAALPPGGGEPASWGQAHYEFIEQLAPPSLIVNQNHDILHVSEHAGRFLEVGGGEPSTQSAAAGASDAARRVARGALPGGTNRRARGNARRPGGTRRGTQGGDAARRAVAVRPGRTACWWSSTSRRTARGPFPGRTPPAGNGNRPCGCWKANSNGPRGCCATRSNRPTPPRRNSRLPTRSCRP